MIVLRGWKRKEGIGCHNGWFFDRTAQEMGLLMYNRIEKILVRYGYESIALNVRGIYLAFRGEEEEGFAVVTLDETQGAILETEQFYHVSEQIRDYLRKRGCYHVHFLYLLVSDNDSSASRLFQNYECFWRIVPGRRQVMVFEQLDEAFMVLRKPLEELFDEEQTMGEVIRENVGNRTVPWITICLVLINVAVFIYTDFFAFSGGQEWVEAGALGWFEVLEEGEWYRLLTSMFLHSGGAHIMNNMLILAYIGSSVELEIGSLRYGILYISSGILAGCSSMVYNMMQNNYTVSVGASGAIFGIIGAMLFIVLFLKERRMQYSVGRIAFMVFLSLYGGFTSQGVDNAAHVGGFIAGFLCMGIISLLRKPSGSGRDDM